MSALHSPDFAFQTVLGADRGTGLAPEPAEPAEFVVTPAQAKTLVEFKCNVGVHQSEDPHLVITAYRPYLGKRTIAVAADGSFVAPKQVGRHRVLMLSGPLHTMAVLNTEFAVREMDGQMVAENAAGMSFELGQAE